MSTDILLSLDRCTSFLEPEFNDTPPMVSPPYRGGGV
jgi:hypothetical protein